LNEEFVLSESERLQKFKSRRLIQSCAVGTGGPRQLWAGWRNAVSTGKRPDADEGEREDSLDRLCRYCIGGDGRMDLPARLALSEVLELVFFLSDLGAGAALKLFGGSELHGSFSR
jgi:hypothetical protein